MSRRLNPSRGRGASSTCVMLPINKISIRDFVFHSDPRHRFLPGNRPELTKETCGKWKWRGCLEWRSHGKFKIVEGQRTLVGNSANVVGDGAHGQDIVEKYELICGDLGCPVCYEKVCSRKAAIIENRVTQFKWSNRKRTRYYHWAVSVPKELYDLDYKQLRKIARDVAKMSGIQGGCVIFHHLRRYNEEDQKEDLAAGYSWQTSPASWYYSPHFHVIGVGFTSAKAIKKMVEKTKKKYGAPWVVVNLGERKSVYSTAMYQLSHAYVPEKGHAVTWFGVMSYNNQAMKDKETGKIIRPSFRPKPLAPQKHECPECGAEFQNLKFVSSEAENIVKSKIQKDGIYRLDHGFFEYKVKEKPPWRGYG